MIRKTAHRNSCRLIGYASARKCKLKGVGCFYCILVKKLIEVSYSDKRHSVGIVSFRNRKSFPNIGLCGNGKLFNVVLQKDFFCFFIFIHKRSEDLLGSLLVLDLRQDLFNLTLTTVKAIKVLIGIAVTSHINKSVILDGRLKTRHISQDIRDRGLFEDLFGYAFRLLFTPLVGLIRLIDCKCYLCSFTDQICICHKVLRHLGRYLAFENLGKVVLSGDLKDLSAVRNDMVTNQIHIDAIFPKRIARAFGFDLIPPCVRLLHLCHKCINRRLVLFALARLLRRCSRLRLFLLKLYLWGRSGLFQKIIVQRVLADTLKEGIKLHFKRNERSVKELHLISCK